MPPDANDILRQGGSDVLRDGLDRAPVRSRANGRAAPKAEPTLPAASDAAALLRSRAPDREWLVDGWIPAHEVTLLGADGGTGKTLLALLLAYACVTGWTWLGMAVRHCRVLYYGAEEPIAELHWRLERIAEQILGVPIPDGWLHLVSVADRDAELATVGRSGAMEPAARLVELERLIQAHAIGLLILDASADVYGADETDRRHVRAFLRILRGVATRCRCTILLLTHPSVDGMRSGRGYSGSTHWNNAVRSRLYMHTPTAGEDGAEVDPDLRELRVMKANRAARGQRVMMRWQNHVFRVEDGAKASSTMERAHARAVFLDILTRLARQGERVSASPSNTYAPARMAKEPEGRAVGKVGLGEAMRELLRDGRVRQVTSGSATRTRSYLAIVE